MGKRKKDPNHSSHRQSAPNPVRPVKRLRDMIDPCVYCGVPVLWEEAVGPNGEKPLNGLLAHIECVEADRSRQARGERSASQFNLDDLLD